MTYEQFKKLPFQLTWHIEMDDCHIGTYQCTADEHIFCQIRQQYLDGKPHGPGEKIYYIHGVECATPESIKKAIVKL